MNGIFKLIFFLFSITSLCYGLGFRMGRSKGGNLGAPIVPPDEKLPKEQWFKQKLNHFNPANNRIWDQRYFVNDSFYDYKKPGPVFLMIGGEGPADPKWMVKGAWIEYAQKYGAFCFNLEHRYYGKSHPTKNKSVKSLQYLSSIQALADLANFINSMNEMYRFPDQVKWVVFGGSYSGSLAAWLRVKYPHLVFGAISSSGPLRAVVNFVEYFEGVVNAITEVTGNESCVHVAKMAHQELLSLQIVTPDVIEEEFKVCKPFATASDNDLKNFYGNIADYFADVVQYNEDNRIGASEESRNITIKSVCHILLSDNTKPTYVRLANFTSMMLNKSNEKCLDYSYNKMIAELRNDTWGEDDARQWLYQTCTEFGFYQTSTSEVYMFGDLLDLEFFVQQCQDVFGKKFDLQFIQNSVEWTNSFYGGLDVTTPRIVYVHGSVDPWHALGITSSHIEDSPAIFINGTAHCADMYPSASQDPAGLRLAREEIVKNLDRWLA